MQIKIPFISVESGGSLGIHIPFVSLKFKSVIYKIFASEISPSFFCLETKGLLRDGFVVSLVYYSSETLRKRSVEVKMSVGLAHWRNSQNISVLFRSSGLDFRNQISTGDYSPQKCEYFLYTRCPILQGRLDCFFLGIFGIRLSNVNYSIPSWRWIPSNLEISSIFCVLEHSRSSS